MSIIYSLVARDQQVLADYAKYGGNFQLSALEVLRMTPASRQFGQVVAAQYTFYTSAKDGFVFLVLVDSTYELRIAFDFLRQIQQEFFSKYNEESRKTAFAHSLNDFSPILQQWMTKYENRAEIDKLAKMRGELSEVQKLTLRNMDKIIDRGEMLAVIVDRSKEVADISYDMASLSTETKRKLRWKKMAIKISIGVICVVVIALVVLFVII